jgi:aspartate/methionine/tyrosine aminotransferase
VLCVYGSGFGTNPADGFFRIVCLAPLDELASIYDSIAAFTADYYRAAGFTPDSVKA